MAQDMVQWWALVNMVTKSLDSTEGRESGDQLS
jgi:hypothetical protein